MEEQNDPSDSAIRARTGRTVTLTTSAPVLEIRSDFDQFGRWTLEDTEKNRSYEEARARRRKRPGSILLPNLEDDPDAPLLPCAPGNPYLTPAQIRPLGQQGLQGGDALMLQCEHASDKPRVAGYGKTVNGWERDLGGSGKNTEIEVPNGWTGEDFRMYACTLAGDPRAPGSAGRPLPREVEDTYEQTSPGEVWIRLRYQQNGTHEWKDDDVALFRIAPLVLQSNLEPARRLYLVSSEHTHSFVYDVREACWDAFGGRGPFPRAPARPFLCSSSSTPGTRRRDQDDESSRPGTVSSNKVYLINSNKYPDPWIQDQMVTGYCRAPEKRSFNVVLNCKRHDDLHDFVTDEMPDDTDNLYAFNGLADSRPAHDTTDFGGNIAVSPPVLHQTDAVQDLSAGPLVPEHPRAPQGKIVLGDCYNESRPGQSEDGTVHEETRTFLQSQGVQPIIPVDTSWLQTGHVNEIMTFVPSPSSWQNRPAKLVMASPFVMQKIVTATRRTAMHDGRTDFHRGRHRQHHEIIGRIIEFEDYKSSGRSRSNELELAQSYDETRIDTFYRGEVGQKSGNIQNLFLNPIEKRLCHCTGLNRNRDVLRLPVHFDYDQSSFGRREQPLAEARSPNLVDMQVLNISESKTHLLLPRPCGPRLPYDKAERTVRKVLNELGRPDTPVRLPQEKKDPQENKNRQQKKNRQPGFSFWAWPGLKAGTLAMFFAHKKRPSETFLTQEDRDQIINAIKRNALPEALPPALREVVENTRQAICNANPECESRLSHATAGRFDKSWNRLFIPENTVDVLEAYTASVLKKIGCTVHFVDAWHHHTAGGGVGRATNVLHKPPRKESNHWTANQRWWKNDSESARNDGSPAYDPTDTDYAWEDAPSF